jgi:DNA primase
MNCPFHADEKASFTIWDGQSKAHCFGCDWHDDYIQFVYQLRKHANPMDAAAEICNRLEIPREGVFTCVSRRQQNDRGKVMLYDSKTLEREDFEEIAEVRFLDATGISFAAPFLRKHAT